jgi:hypothetical protein
MVDIDGYNLKQDSPFREICEQLKDEIFEVLLDSESKIWHGHPVWFLGGNPIVGYSVQRAGVRLMFWSGRSFDDPYLVGTSKFRDGSMFYNSIDEIDLTKLHEWLKKAVLIQWDYKNIVKRRGELIRLK